MAAKTRADDRDRATERELYLPAGVVPPVDTSPFARLRAWLFDRRV